MNRLQKMTVAGCIVSVSELCAQNAIPKNPYLADSPWPTTHGNSYNQDSSPLPGPDYESLARGASVSTISTQPVSITMAISAKYPDGSQVVWGNNRNQVSKSSLNPRGLSLIEITSRHTPASTEITGAYALIDEQNRYWVPRDLDIDLFYDEVPNQSGSEIKHRKFDLASQLGTSSKPEYIIGFGATWDGYFVFATNLGRVGVTTREIILVDSLQLGPAGLSVSNSIAIDENGGIYVVTDKNLQKIFWDGQKLQPVWSVPYQSDVFYAPGKLGQGSGTSPTLMGAGSDEDRLVLISDGRKRMNMLLAWRDEIPEDWRGLPGRDRRIAAEVPVLFGKNAPSKAITEQSIAVWGYGAVIVDNSYGDIGGVAERIARRRGHSLDHATIYLSNEPNVAPFGVEKFEWNPVMRKLQRVWARPDISCPNGIPVISGASKTFYCVGQRRRVWNIEAMDLATGSSRFYLPLSKTDFHNSFYANLEIGPFSSLLTGSYGGGFAITPDQ
jgi:hypothetical protein